MYGRIKLHPVFLHDENSLLWSKIAQERYLILSFSMLFLEYFLASFPSLSFFSIFLVYNSNRPMYVCQRFSASFPSFGNPQRSRPEHVLIPFPSFFHSLLFILFSLILKYYFLSSLSSSPIQKLFLSFPHSEI